MLCSLVKDISKLWQQIVGSRLYLNNTILLISPVPHDNWYWKKNIGSKSCIPATFGLHFKDLSHVEIVTFSRIYGLHGLHNMALTMIILSSTSSKLSIFMVMIGVLDDHVKKKMTFERVEIYIRLSYISDWESVKILISTNNRDVDLRPVKLRYTGLQLNLQRTILPKQPLNVRKLHNYICKLNNYLLFTRYVDLSGFSNISQVSNAKLAILVPAPVRQVPRRLKTNGVCPSTHNL